MQDNRFTTKEILKVGEHATDASEIKLSDLTEEGFQFYKYGIIKWRAKYDRAKDEDRAINDFAYYIEKILREFRSRNIAGRER